MKKNIFLRLMFVATLITIGFLSMNFKIERNHPKKENHTFKKQLTPFELGEFDDGTGTLISVYGTSDGNVTGVYFFTYSDPQGGGPVYTFTPTIWTETGGVYSVKLFYKEYSSQIRNSLYDGALAYY